MCRVMKEVFPVKGGKLHNSILAYEKYMHTRYEGKMLTTVEPEQKVCMAYVILPIFVSVSNFP